MRQLGGVAPGTRRSVAAMIVKSKTSPGKTDIQLVGRKAQSVLPFLLQTFPSEQ